MSGSIQRILSLDLPAPLVETLRQAGFSDPVLQGSDMALSLSVFVRDPGLMESENDDARRDLGQAVLSIRQAALQTGLDLPVLVVIDLGLGDKIAATYQSFRREFDRWAADQDWHRGDFALYLCPPVDPTSDGWAEWTGPRNRDEMVQHLLGPGVADWGLSSMEPQTLVGIASQLEAWAADRGLDRSEIAGDLVLSAAATLRGFDRARAESRGSVAVRSAVEEARQAIDAWVARRLGEAESSGASREDPT